MPLVTRMDLGGSYSKWIQQQRNKIADDVPSRQSKHTLTHTKRERDTVEVIYHTKETRRFLHKELQGKNGKG